VAIRLIHVRCRDCGAETNKVEYDPDGRDAKVQQVASALGITVDEASAYVAAHNADPHAQAVAYANTLTDDTISPCPQGHTGALEVVEL
jgi:Flp pilus assembly CpaF family ATPase